MSRSIVGIAAAFAMLASHVSIADTDTTIDFSGTYVRPYTPSISGTFSGDVVIDTTTGSVVSASISDASATYNVSCIPGSCGFVSSNLFFEDNHLLVTQTSLVGITTLTPASESGLYNGVSFTDHGVFDTHSGTDTSCGGIACIMTSISYSVPGSSPTAAPEMDPSVAGSAMAILFGSLVIMRNRRRSSAACPSDSVDRG